MQKFYTGHTNDLQNRIIRHNSGYEKFTKIGAPWDLIWKMEFSTRSEAVLLESKIKNRGAKRFLSDMEMT
jgi:putative endonuclease